MPIAHEQKRGEKRRGQHLCFCSSDTCLSAYSLFTFLLYFSRKYPVDGRQVSKIGQGICVLIGLSVSDTSADLDYMVRKLLSVKVFDSHTVPEGQTADLSTPNKGWAKSVVDIGGEILCGK